MKISQLLIPAALLIVGGCARSPEGGPVNPTAPNRLTVNLRTESPINNAYIYAFAFDDDGDASDGPIAVVSSSPLPNGIVGGSFSALVIYQAGQYTVFRRTELDGANERLERVASAFVVPPAPATGNNLSFILNLDARTDPDGDPNTVDGVRLFNIRTADNPNGVERLDANFIATNEIRRDPNDLRRKAYDAFGNFLASFFATFDIRGTRVFTNQELVQEPTGDVQSDDTNNTINLSQLDIADFSISIERQ